MTTIHPLRILALASSLGISTVALAEVSLPAVFSDHMVLQRDLPVPVWGTANPGESVTVRFADRMASTVAGADGAWRVTLDPLAAS